VPSAIGNQPGPMRASVPTSNSRAPLIPSQPKPRNTSPARKSLLAKRTAYYAGAMLRALLKLN
jgi:hypothetical protein